MGAELYGYFSDGELNPPDTWAEPITECDECGREIYEGQDAYVVYIDESLTFCSDTCLMSNIGVEQVTMEPRIGVDDEW